jgi:hypothetical protein
MQVTLENVLNIVGQMYDKVENIERLALLRDKQMPVDNDRWFDIIELCQYLPDKPEVKTVYGWKSKNLIPFHKPAKKLSFLKSEIDQWIKTDRGRVVLASSYQNDNYLKPQRKKKKIK